MSTREVTSFPTPSHSTLHPPNASGWFGKQVLDLRSPLSHPWSSKEGLLEIASRVCFLALVLIPVVLIGYYFAQRWKTVPPPENPLRAATIHQQQLSPLNAPDSPYKTPLKHFKGQIPSVYREGGLTPVKRPLTSDHSTELSSVRRTLLLSPESTAVTLDDTNPDERVQQDVKKIAQAYADLANNLHELSGGKGKSFEQLCRDFENLYLDDPQYSKYMEEVNKYWMRFCFLVSPTNHGLLWFHMIAGREGALFKALLPGLNNYFRGRLWPDKSVPQPTSMITLAEYLNRKMKEMIADDPVLEELTHAAIQAAAMAFEAELHSEEDQLINDITVLGHGSYQSCIEMFNRKQELDALKHDVASSTYPLYFKLKEKELKPIGSLNAIYVFCKLFPGIKVEIPNDDEPFCYNPEGTFTLTLGMNDQNQFIYMPKK